LGRAGLVVIDADRHDPKEDGVQAFAGLRAEHQEFPHPQTLTAGGGEHSRRGRLRRDRSACDLRPQGRA
jgi:hypothetical protein